MNKSKFRSKLPPHRVYFCKSIGSVTDDMNIRHLILLRFNNTWEIWTISSCWKKHYLTWHHRNQESFWCHQPTFRITGTLWGESTGQRWMDFPHTGSPMDGFPPHRASNGSFDVSLNNLLKKNGPVASDLRRHVTHVTALWCLQRKTGWIILSSSALYQVP